jgi:uncharacterized membrane protein YhaH (DUF805 family)
MLTNILSHEGKINRITFLIYFVLFLTLTYNISSLILLEILLCYFYIIQLKKRLADIGFKMWFIFILFVPIKWVRFDYWYWNLISDHIELYNILAEEEWSENILRSLNHFYVNYFDLCVLFLNLFLFLYPGKSDNSIKDYSINFNQFKLKIQAIFR